MLCTRLLLLYRQHSQVYHGRQLFEGTCPFDLSSITYLVVASPWVVQQFILSDNMEGGKGGVTKLPHRFLLVVLSTFWQLLTVDLAVVER